MEQEAKDVMTYNETSNAYLYKEKKSKNYSTINLFDKIFKYFTLFSAFVLGITLFSIMFFVGKTGILTFKDVSISTFLFSLDWTPEDGKFGAGLFILGTLSLTALTLLIATPISLCIAVFISEIAPGWLKKFMRPVLDLLVGIPSIVYGYLGLTVLLPIIRKVTGQLIGEGLMAAALVLALMILPTITRLSDDALSFLPNEYKEAAYALGSTRWELTWKILLPAAKNGIITGIVLGMARAIGETMAVVMVIGNVAQIPGNIFTPTSVLTSNIVMQITSVMYGTTWSNALYMMAFLLLIVSLLLIGIVRFIRVKGEKVA